MTRVNSTTKETNNNFNAANGTGAAVRAAINNIFDALRTINAASGDPSGAGNVVQYQPHIDAATNKLKICTAVSSGTGTFTEIGDITQQNLGLASKSAANTFTSTNIFQEDVTFDGATAGRDVVFDRSDNALEFADNAKAKFGTGDDLQIYHDGSNSYIFENGTGDLKIETNGSTIQLGKSNGEVCAKFIIDGSVELYEDNVKKFETASGGVSLTGGAAANITALSDGSTITIDMATACHHSVTLGGNRTFAAPSNQVVGQAGSIFITQDGTGSRTASFNSAFKFAGGTAPTLSTAAGAVDRIDYIILSSNAIHCAVSLDVK